MASSKRRKCLRTIETSESTFADNNIRVAASDTPQEGTSNEASYFDFLEGSEFSTCDSDEGCSDYDFPLFFDDESEGCEPMEVDANRVCISRAVPFNDELYKNRKLHEPLYPSSTISKFDATIMAMTFSIRHKLTYVAIEDLMKLINGLFGKEVMSTSKFKCNSLFYKKGDFEYHFYCSKCKTYIGKLNECKDIEKCVRDGCSQPFSIRNKNRGCYFVMLPMEPQLRNLFEEPGIQQYFMNVSERIEDDQVISDIYDGAIYKKLVADGVINPKTDATITTSCDASQVFKSGKNSVTPIQFRLNELVPSERLAANRLMTAGLWFGREEPVMSTFFTPFIREASKLATDGVIWFDESTKKPKCTKVFTIGCVTDSIGRPKVQNVKQFNGKFGCPYCLNPGVNLGEDEDDPKKRNNHKYVKGVYPNRSNSSMRLDMALALKSGKEVNGVKGPTPFYKLDYFDVCFGFPLDWMHACTIGICKFMFSLWFTKSGRGKEPYHVSKIKQMKIDGRFRNIKPPSSISRLPGSFFQHPDWKANEWRSFLFYYFYPCLNGILPEKYLSHFSLFAAALYILLQERISKDELLKADRFLREFVDQFASLYSEDDMRFNVHAALHLTKTVEMCGPLWTTSAFQFEAGQGGLVALVNGTIYVVDEMALKILVHTNVMLCLTGNFVQSREAFDYCNSLMTFSRSKNSSAHGGATVLGNFKEVPLNETQKLALVGSGIEGVEMVKSCEKIIFKKMKIEPYGVNRKETKFDDSLVQLKDGHYYKVEIIFLNPFDSSSLLMLGKKMKLQNPSNIRVGCVPIHVKICELYPFETLSIHDVKEIVQVSILMKGEPYYYITDFPNRLEKD